MAQEEEMSSLFPVFALSIVALLAIPWTLYRVSAYLSSTRKKKPGCPCSLCQQCPKNRPSLSERVGKFLSLSNLVLLGLWITMIVLLAYIRTLSQEIKPFEPFSILGLDPGASEADVKKAYRRLSLQYHPDKNPDPAAHKYFVDFISKAYQALTDEQARKNWEEYGHPDGQQSMNVGIALPKFMLDIQGVKGAYLLLGLVGVGILFPLVIVVIYLSRSSKYTGNYIMHSTISNYYYLIKPSLAPSKVMDVLTHATEFLELKLRSVEVEPTEKLFGAVRSELNLDPKNLKQETAKFFRRRPGLVKVELLLHAHLLRESGSVPHVLKKDYDYVLGLVPRLLEELMKMALFQRTHNGHGWLRPAMGVMELSQCIMQAVPLSTRKVSEKAALAGVGLEGGMAGLLQLPHLDEAAIKKMGRKRVRSLQELRELSEEERGDVLRSMAGLNASQVEDVEGVLSSMPDVAVDACILTEGEEGIEEDDLVTLRVWLTMRRGNGQIVAQPHTPYFPLKKEEAFWLLLADTTNNTTWVSQRVTFLDEAAAVRAASDYTREAAEGEGADDAEVNARVSAAREKVRAGARLVVAKFRAPAEGTYNVTAMLLSDVWIGCDKRVPLKLKVGKRTRAGTRVGLGDHLAAARAEEEEEEDYGDRIHGEEEDSEPELEMDEDDYLSEYSEDEEEYEEDGEAEDEGEVSREPSHATENGGEDSKRKGKEKSR